MDGRDEVSTGELMRTLERIGRDVTEQGKEITAVRIDVAAFRASVTQRLGTIEGTQATEAAARAADPVVERRGSVAKPIIGWGSLGASVLWLLQWLASQVNAKGPTP